MIHAARTRTTAPRRRPAARAGTGLIARAGTGLIALTVLAGACGFGGGDEDASSDDNCTRVPAAVSSEKIQLMTELGDDFARSWDGSGCVRVEAKSVPSGRAAVALAEGWNADELGPQPVLWSPAASSWGAILNQRSAEADGALTVPTDPPNFMLTPLVLSLIHI